MHSGNCILFDFILTIDSKNRELRLMQGVWLFCCIIELYALCKGGNFKNYYFLGVVRLFHLLNKGHQVPFIIW